MTTSEEPSPPAPSRSGPGVEERRLFPAQRRILETYEKWRERRPTPFELVLPLVPRWCLMATLAAASFLISFEAALVLCGFFCGAAVRQAVQLYHAYHFAPILREIIDWEKLRAVLRDDEVADGASRDHVRAG